MSEPKLETTQSQPSPAAQPPQPCVQRTAPAARTIIFIAIAGVMIGALLVATVGFTLSPFWTQMYSEVSEDFEPGTSTGNSGSSSIPDPGTGGGLDVPTGETVDTVEVAARVLPSVVGVSVQRTGQNSFGQPFSAASGSGVIVDAQGHIVTNYHVIASGEAIEVTVGDRTYEATVVGEDATTDLAVLKIEAENLTPIAVGSAQGLKVGQFAMAVGSPFGLDTSVSTGIISGLGRSTYMENPSYISAFLDLIQTDAAINPGNSGGALVNAAGELIGINTLIQSTSGSSAGVGFAIPVETVVDVARQLIEDGIATHTFLGVSSQTVTPEVAEWYDLPVDQGAYVTMVSEGSPAEAAGIRSGDIITQIDGDAISGQQDVFSQVRRRNAGEQVQIVLYRGGQQMTVTATLATDAGR